MKQLPLPPVPGCRDNMKDLLFIWKWTEACVCLFDINYQADLRMCSLIPSSFTYSLENLNLSSELQLSQFFKIPFIYICRYPKITIPNIPEFPSMTNLIIDNIVSIFYFTCYTVPAAPVSSHPITGVNISTSYPDVQLCLYEFLCNLITNRSSKMT